MRMLVRGPLSPLVQDSASSSSSDASFASVLGNTCPLRAAPPHSTFPDSTLPGDDVQTLTSKNGVFLTRSQKLRRMEMRLGHCLFTILLEWIWLLTTTSILGGTKAEVRCIPSCQRPLITAFPRELSAVDLTNFGEASAEEIAGFIEGFLGAKSTVDGDEKPDLSKISAGEESSSKEHSRLGGSNTSFIQKDALDHGQQKLSHHQEVFSGSVLRAAGPSPRDAHLNDNSADDGKNKSHHAENLSNDYVTVEKDAGASSWKRTRSTRSAETWSGFRPEGVEDASFSDPEEFQLTGSTFALTGDSAHNQAMVHWSGQNSSVSI